MDQVGLQDGQAEVDIGCFVLRRNWRYVLFIHCRSHSCFFHCAELETDCHVVVEDGDQCHFGSYLNNDQPYPNPNVILKEKNWIVNYKSGDDSKTQKLKAPVTRSIFSLQVLRILSGQGRGSSSTGICPWA